MNCNNIKFNKKNNFKKYLKKNSKKLVNKTSVLSNSSIKAESLQPTANSQSAPKVPFTCIGKGFGAPCKPATLEEWQAARRDPKVAELCARIEKGENLKFHLPVWTPHCALFKDDHRAVADAQKPLNRLMLDFDEKGHTDDILAKMEDGMLKADGSELEVLLVEESVRRGTHVLITLPEGMTPDEAQKLAEKATGFKPDQAVKDIARCIFMVPEDHTRYVSEKLAYPQPLPQGKGEESLPLTPPSKEGKSLPLTPPSREGKSLPLTPPSREGNLKRGLRG